MIIGIILAAGKSTRFGSDKRRSRLANGSGLLEQSILNASSIVNRVIVVLRATDQKFAEQLRLRFTEPAVQIYLAPDSAAGMAHSLANAIHQLPSCDGVMIFLGDMPYLAKATIEQLLAAFDEHRKEAPIIVPTILSLRGTSADTIISDTITSDTVPGHPVIFSSAYLQELAQLTGDNGAKPVITRHQDNVIRVGVEDDGILKDIDRPDDMQP